MPPERVADALLFHQIDFPAKDFGQLILHIHPIIEGDAAARLEAHQHVYITVGTEVIPQNRAEQGKFLDLPLATEGFNLFLGKLILG